MKNYYKLGFILLSSAIISGCVGDFNDYYTQNVTINKRFDELQAMEAVKPGYSTIKGNALLRRKDGRAITCAGFNVTLIPATDYAEEIIRLQFEGKKYRPVKPSIRFTNVNGRFYTYQLKTICDAHGNFEFDNISAGTYFVYTKVVWNTQYSVEGGYLYQKVNIGEGKTKKIILTD